MITHSSATDKPFVQGSIKNGATCFPVIKVYGTNENNEITPAVFTYIRLDTDVIYTPVVGDIFSNDGCTTDYEYTTYCHRANVAGTGYSAGDLIFRTDKVDSSTNAIVSTVWYNAETAAVIAAPATADLDDCDTATSSFMQKVWDYLPNGEPVELNAVYTLTAGAMTVAYFTLTGTPYAIVGTVYEAQDNSVNKGNGEFVLVANTSTALPAAPVYTSFATVQFKNGGGFYRTDGVAASATSGFVATPGQVVYLYNNDVAGFRALSTGATTRIVYEFRNHQHEMPQ